MANTTQVGGSALTIQRNGQFDGIVFGERDPGRWMAGSDMFKRSRQQQEEFPAETASGETFVQIAIVYRDKQVTIYRNGAIYASYPVESQEPFPADSKVLMGLRHVGAAPENRFFTGAIGDARIYPAALSAEQLAALKPNLASEPIPFAWWDFENGAATDRMKTFPTTTLFNEARIADGRLHLDKNGAFLMASRETLESGQTAGQLNDANSAARALREKLLSDPHRPGYHFAVPQGQARPVDPTRPE